MLKPIRLNLIAILALGAGACGADYSPLLAGYHTWRYLGKGEVQPLSAASTEGFDGHTVRYSESLTLRVATVSTSAAKAYVRVEERDSLYARTRWNKNGGSETQEGTLPDTVIVRILAYDYGPAFHLAKGDSLGFGHRDSMDLFFWSNTTVPYKDADLTGLTAPWKGMSSNIPYRGSSPMAGPGSAWYLDGVGLYWAKVVASCGQCGCWGSRELMLQTFDGKPVDPGIDPPGTPLAKGSRIACGLAKPARRGPAFLRPGSGNEINALGRDFVSGRK